MRSLFPYPDVYIEQFEKRHAMTISKEFVSCADEQLTNSFEHSSGMRVNRLIEVGWAHETAFFYIKGPVSRLASLLWVNNQTSEIYICWKTYSGTVIEPGDRKMDCSDLVFWFEKMDPLLYHRQLFPSYVLPFKLDGLSYELDIKRLNISCMVIMTTIQNDKEKTAHLSAQIDEFIDSFNAASVKKDRKNGVVHSWKSEVRADQLIYEIDMGSAGSGFLKKILLFLSGLGAFKKIEIE
jgi:hypothetical protein